MISICLIVRYVWTLKSRCDYFKRRGLSGPPSVLFFGHYRTLWSLPDLSEQLRRWTQQYGSIYGLFEGTRPMYVVSDVDFLHEVFAKQFASFNARSIPFLMKKVRGHQVHMFGASGPTWRRQRHVINPTFSAAKLRLMSSPVNHCIESLMDKLKNMEENGEQFNIYEIYRRLTMDVICKYFSLETFATDYLRKEQKSRVL
jgi:cytochrome P450